MLSAANRLILRTLKTGAGKLWRGHPWKCAYLTIGLQTPKRVLGKSIHFLERHELITEDPVSAPHFYKEEDEAAILFYLITDKGKERV